MITIIADTQHIAKRYARIVGASDEDTRHYVGNNYAVTWLEGIDLGFSPDTRPPFTNGTAVLSRQIPRRATASRRTSETKREDG